MGLKYLPPFGSGVSHRFYGKTLTDVKKELEIFNKDPNFNFGWVDYKMECNCDFDKNTNELVLPIYLEIKLFLFMPVWQYSFRPPAEQAEWLRVYNALYIHEKGHIAIFEREANVMYTRICMSKTHDELTAVYNNEKNRIESMQKHHDTVTGRGTNQISEYGNTILNW
jgi:Bacterial protein of unknown function (DUF922)